MEEEFVIYPLALRMKKLGYDKPCFAFYQVENFEEKPCGVDDRDEYIRTGFATCKNSEIPEHFTSAPTWQSAFAWFREKYKIHHRVDIQDLSENLYDYEILEVLDGFNDTYTGSSFKSYEEAQTACLKKIIKIAEKK